MITDRSGVPLLVATTPANWRDDKPALELLARLPQLPDPHGQWHRRPLIVQADRGYGYCQVMLPLMLRGIVPLISRAMEKTHGSGLGQIRYVVERTLSWFNDYRRIRQCVERTSGAFQAFHELAAALICLKKIRHVVSHF